MDYFLASQFIFLAHEIAGLRHYFQSGDLGEAALPDELREALIRTFTKVQQECEAQGLLSCSDCARRIVGLMELEAPPKHSELAGLYNDFLRRMEDETARFVFLRIAPSNAARYKSPLVGWEEVLARFQVSTDIEEMQKCFALARYPAAIYHSLQVVEAGLIALAPFIGDHDPFPGWTSVSGRLRVLVDKPFKDWPDDLKEHKQFLIQLQGTVEALKNAWRHKISHAHGKLALIRPEFTPEIAEEIVLATRAFMRRLATELPKGPE